MSEAFSTRLLAAIAERGPLCVGIDPHPHLLQQWGLPDSAAGLREFALASVEAVGAKVAAMKPQSAFFETYGSAGIAVLEETLAAIKEKGALSVLDAKRGDIGSTMSAYARAYLGTGPLAADALTVTAYVGFAALEPAVAAAKEHGKGLFVLAVTSNPEGYFLQSARESSTQTVAGSVFAQAAQENAAFAGVGQAQADSPPPPGTYARELLGPVGVVWGATAAAAARELGIDLRTLRGPFLVPGFGAQGGDLADLRAVFAGIGGVLVNSSRAILGAGPQAGDLASAAILANRQLREALEA